MLIRTFEARDVAPACRLTNHFIEHTAVHFGYTPATEAEFAGLWVSGRDRFPWLTCEVDGAFAGYAKAGTWRTREAYAPTAETTVYVELEYHRRGVGRALYAELLGRLRAAGFHSAVGGITVPKGGRCGCTRRRGSRMSGHFGRQDGSSTSGTTRRGIKSCLGSAGR